MFRHRQFRTLRKRNQEPPKSKIEVKSALQHAPATTNCDIVRALFLKEYRAVLRHLRFPPLAAVGWG
jgi:hypothetical protein